MKLIRSISSGRILAQCIFLLLPASFMIGWLLWNSQHYFSILHDNWTMQTLECAAGIFISFFIYQSRWRFVPTFASLIILLTILYTSINHMAFGEFDGFFISVKFLVFSYLFTLGWLLGWGFYRYHFFSIVFSGILILFSAYVIAKLPELNTALFLSYLIPVAVFTLYIIYVSNILRQNEQTNFQFWLRFSRRMLLFMIVNFLICIGITVLMWKEINAKMEEYGGQGKEGENQMLETKKDGSVQNRQSMGLNGSNQRNKNPAPLFCAHINNFFPDSEMPNPLYLTSMHFSKFDTLTETFERDETLPFNDEFQPNLANIPLFKIKEDSSRIRNARSNKFRNTIDIEVYKKRLSANFFVGPSTAFWVQPITVEKEFKGEYYAAYRAKSYVSSLNSAYFIYNADNIEIKLFQEQRFQELRKAKDYSEIPKDFFNYYTFFPSSANYLPIKTLADSISTKKTTTIDKVLAVRDYFLQKNELGQPLFTYTDNPGIPGLPGSSKIMHFLFESKKGYCAYYAAATVFILRAMKIPCRVVTGFLTVDRSDKNAGWYWFYEDQSHGWVQVYFPEYGWIDFDTTVGDDEAQRSPAPDGTPPLHPPKPLLVIEGDIQTKNNQTKEIKVIAQSLLFRDAEYKLNKYSIPVSLVNCDIWKDSVKVLFNDLKESDHITAISYDEKYNQFSSEKEGINLLHKLPSPISVDEVFIQPKVNKTTKANATSLQKTSTNWKAIAIQIVLLIGGFIILLLSLPYFMFCYYRYRANYAKNVAQKSYFSFMTASFLLHQFKIQRHSQSYLQFAQLNVDPTYQTQFGMFMKIYLKTKYAGQSLNEYEISALNIFLKPFIEKIKHAFKWHQRFGNFLNLVTFIHFYTNNSPEHKK